MASRAAAVVRRFAQGHPRLKRVLKAIRFMPLAAADSVWRARHRSALRGLNLQPVSVVTTTLPFETLTGPDSVRAVAPGAMLGSNAVYLPPSRVFALPEGFPSSAGLKVLLDPRPPAEARYLNPEKQGPGRNAAAGQLHDNMLAANYLYAHGLGPRVWGVAEVRGANGARGSAFVVDHVDAPRRADESDCDSFLAALDRAVGTELQVAYPGWRRTGDFAPPDCNGNLLIGDADVPQYVDFQNFRVDQIAWLERLAVRHAAVSHFGETRPGRPSEYLYQSVPGLEAASKRNVSRRWDRLTEALTGCGIALEGRLVLDIGTNIGMILHQALANGARWGVGWDHPSVATAATEFQLAVGNGRFDVIGADLDEAYDFGAALRPELRPLLDEAVVFFLSVHRHIGFPEWLNEGRWAALVYEGHDGESAEEAASNARRLVGADSTITPVRMGTDGDSGRRPYCVAVR